MGHLATLGALAVLDVPLFALLPLALAPLIVVWHALRVIDKARHIYLYETGCSNQVAGRRCSSRTAADASSHGAGR